MSIAAQIRNKLEQMPKGQVLTYADFAELGEFTAIASALSRLTKAGRLRRLSKGRYYIPRKTRFGEVGPSEDQVLGVLLEQNGGQVGSLAALNKFGVTTQVPNVISIFGARSTRELKIGALKVKFIRGSVNSNGPRSAEFFAALEALRLIRRTPDGDKAFTIKKVRDFVRNLPAADLKNFVNAARSAKPSVRALLGALLELEGEALAVELERTLNPLTKYVIGLSPKTLPNMKKWKIE